MNTNYYGQLIHGDDRIAGLAQYGPVVDASTPLVDEKPRGWLRRRMNFVPIFICLFVPCAFFAGVAWTIGFHLHYEHRNVMYLVVVAALLVTLIVGAFAYKAIAKAKREREPNWLMFLFLTMLIACILACICGGMLYSKYMLQYYDFQGLNNYVDVDPSQATGQGHQDAGYIVFVNGTFLELPKSMGFKDVDVFCVAPIAIGNSPMATYDFWVVGKNCCDGVQADFHCENYDDPKAKGGMRLMSDADRAYYRLAVQQAEATYNIKAEHPLFFEWTHDVAETMDGWQDDAHRDYLVWTGSFFAFMFFLTLSAATCFSKHALA